MDLIATLFHRPIWCTSAICLTGSWRRRSYHLLLELPVSGFKLLMMEHWCFEIHSDHNCFDYLIVEEMLKSLLLNCTYKSWMHFFVTEIISIWSWCHGNKSSYFKTGISNPDFSECVNTISHIKSLMHDQQPVKSFFVTFSIHDQ